MLKWFIGAMASLVLVLAAIAIATTGSDATVARDVNVKASVSKPKPLRWWSNPADCMRVARQIVAEVGPDDPYHSNYDAIEAAANKTFGVYAEGVSGYADSSYATIATHSLSLGGTEEARAQCENVTIQ